MRTQRILTIVMIIALLTGCAEAASPAATPAESMEKEENMQIANPWKDYGTLKEAEEAAGFSLDIPDVIADSYRVEVFRVMNGELLEVIYRDEKGHEVRIRKRAGEGNDISGNYNQYKKVTEEELPNGNGSVTYKTDGTDCQILASYGGYSWSLYAPDGFSGDSAAEFINDIAAIRDTEVKEPEGGEDTEQIHSVYAAYPAAITDMTVDEFAESDRRWKWWSDYREKIDASIAVQDGMDDYYSSIMQELLTADDKENKVCSPLNIYVALAMLAEVTDGESREQILDALHADSVEDLRERVSTIWEANYVDVPSLKTILADSLWMRDNLEYNEETLRTLADRYYASAFSGPMGSAQMNQALRDWTDENTGGLLKDYTKNLQMSPETVMALVSTIYYKAAWYDKFYEDATNKETFHGAAGDTEVDMMHATDSMQVFFGDNYTAISKGLQDSGSMYFFLPKEGTDVNDVIRNSQVLDLIRGHYDGSGETRLVHMSVPRFKVQAQTDLIDTLKSLGISDVMDAGKANFSPLTEAVGEIYLSSAEHSAMVEVEEEGVTGAAYTILMLAEGAALEEPEEFDFVLDKPFYFVVTSRDSSILFGGVIQNIE